MYPEPRHETKLSAMRELVRLANDEHWTDDDVLAASSELFEQCHPNDTYDTLRRAFNAISGDELNPKNLGGDNGIEKGSKLAFFLEAAAMGIIDAAYRHVARVLGVDEDGFCAIMGDKAYDSTLPQHQVTLETIAERSANYWKDEPVSSSTPQ